MKVLNLDKIGTKEKRTLKLAGVSYPVEDMTVENFITTTRAAEALANEPSVATQIEATIDMILRSVPSITKEILKPLELEQLQAIVAFVRGDDVEGVEKEEGEAEAGK